MSLNYQKKEQTETKFVFECKQTTFGKYWLRTGIIGSVVSALVVHYWYFSVENNSWPHLFWAFPLGCISILILGGIVRQNYGQDTFPALMIFDNELGQVVFLEEEFGKMVSQFSYNQIEKIDLQVVKRGERKSNKHFLNIVLKDTNRFSIEIDPTSKWVEELNEFIDWSKGDASVPRNYRLPSNLKIMDTATKLVLSYKPDTRASIVLNSIFLVPYFSFGYMIINRFGYVVWLISPVTLFLHFFAFAMIIYPLALSLTYFFANRNCINELSINHEVFELKRKRQSGKITKHVTCPVDKIKSVSHVFEPLTECILTFEAQSLHKKAKKHKFVLGNVSRFDLMELEQYCQFQISRFSGKEVC